LQWNNHCGEERALHMTTGLLSVARLVGKGQGYALLPRNGRFGATLSVANKVPAQSSRRFMNSAG